MTCDRTAALRRLRFDFAAIQMEWALIKLGWKYRPDQPRVPAGHPDGGQWTDAGGAFLGRLRQAAPDWPSTHTDDPNRFVRVATNEPKKPNVVAIPMYGVDPLDPRVLNAAPTPKELEDAQRALYKIIKSSPEEIANIGKV